MRIDKDNSKNCEKLSPSMFECVQNILYNVYISIASTLGCLREEKDHNSSLREGNQGLLSSRIYKIEGEVIDLRKKIIMLDSKLDQLENRIKHIESNVKDPGTSSLSLMDSPLPPRCHAPINFGDIEIVNQNIPIELFDGIACVNNDFYINDNGKWLKN